MLLQIKDDAGGEAGAKAEAEAAQRGNLLMNALWSIVGGQKQQVRIHWDQGRGEAQQCSACMGK